MQVLGLAVLFSRNRGPLGWRQLGGTTARTLAATSGMTLATWGMLRHVSPAPGLVNELLRVVVPLTIGAAAYAVVYTTVGFREMKTFWKAFPEDQVEVD